LSYRLSDDRSHEDQGQEEGEEEPQVHGDVVVAKRAFIVALALL